MGSLGGGGGVEGLGRNRAGREVKKWSSVWYTMCVRVYRRTLSSIVVPWQTTNENDWNLHGLPTLKILGNSTLSICYRYLVQGIIRLELLHVKVCLFKKTDGGVRTREDGHPKLRTAARRRTDWDAVRTTLLTVDIDKLNTTTMIRQCDGRTTSMVT